jgi:hypothetical protein
MCGAYMVPVDRLERAVELLRYFVAFHTAGDMPAEFQGGQLPQRIEQAKKLIACPI